MNIIHGNSLKVMSDHADIECCYDLIITSPPYNLQKEYEDKKSLHDYNEKPDEAT